MVATPLERSNLRTRLFQIIDRQDEDVIADIVSGRFAKIAERIAETSSWKNVCPVCFGNRIEPIFYKRSAVRFLCDDCGADADNMGIDFSKDRDLTDEEMEYALGKWVSRVRVLKRAAILEGMTDGR